MCLEHAVLHSVIVEFVHECKETLMLSVDALLRVLQIMMSPPKRAKGERDQVVADRVQFLFERVVRRTIRNGEENTFDLFKTATVPKVISKNVSMKNDGECGQGGDGDGGSREM